MVEHHANVECLIAYKILERSLFREVKSTLSILSTATVHGVLGQTFAESHRALLQEAVAAAGSNSTTPFDASDVVEGKDADYLTSSLLATDNKFNRFGKPCNGFFSSKQSVALRKMLGVEAPMKQVVSGAISCTSQRDGLVTCSS